MILSFVLSKEKCEMTQKNLQLGLKNLILLTKYSKLNTDHTIIVTVIKIMIEFLFCITSKYASKLLFWILVIANVQYT